MEFIDAHLHLDQYPESETDKLISEWRSVGITGLVAVSTNLASAYRTLELKHRYPDFVYAAVGYHPEQALPLSFGAGRIVFFAAKRKGKN
ncbi:TatD family hydrolase [Aneurinibacillus aneurinilyticus]|uniref:TatD family hydrolase n=1 Tax=Aneurinibacillus aneurinilyticus TaxID=1391 RepID=UPI002E224683|nr:TatD family hydrolase [Aneurinibacillus aneurinilyticus]MED0669958.1 TatD family hydrolase [Aneurinibacillus aneurinilyticus]